MGEPKPPEDSLSQRLQNVSGTPEYLRIKAEADQRVEAGDIYNNFISQFSGGRHRDLLLRALKVKEDELKRKVKMGEFLPDSEGHSELYVNQTAQEFCQAIDDAINAEGLDLGEIRQTIEDIKTKPEVRIEKIRELCMRTTGVYARLICVGYSRSDLI